MVIPRRINNKVFANKVLDFILDELCNLREKFEHGDEQLINRPDEQKYTPFYQAIGKAATLFAVMYKDKVKLTMLRNRRRFPHTALVLDDFVNKFSNSFFQRVEPCPQPWFPVIVLTYCGVFGAIADVCRNAYRPDLVDVCKVNLELDMRTLVEDIQVTCGWRSFYATSSVYAGLYDTKFWNSDSDEEQAQGESAEELEEKYQYLLQDYSPEIAQIQAQEAAQEVQEPGLVQPQEVQEPGLVQPQEVQEPGLVQPQEVQEPGLVQPQEVQEPGLVQPQEVQEPGLVQPQEVQEPGLVQPQEVQEPGLVQPQEVQEPGLVQPQEVQEPGLVQPQARSGRRRRTGTGKRKHK